MMELEKSCKIATYKPVLIIFIYLCINISIPANKHLGHV